MSRSQKKGPFVDFKVFKKVQAALSDRLEGADQDLGPGLHDRAGVRRPDVHGSQRQAAPEGVRDGRHGRPSPRRVRPDADLQGARRQGEEGIGWSWPASEVVARGSASTERSTARCNMPFKATHRHARISARKVRLLADMIRGKFADEALDILKYQPQRGARMLEKVLQERLGQRPGSRSKPGQDGARRAAGGHRRPGRWRADVQADSAGVPRHGVHDQAADGAHLTLRLEDISEL